MVAFHFYEKNIRLNPRSSALSKLGAKDILDFLLHFLKELDVTVGFFLFNIVQCD